MGGAGHGGSFADEGGRSEGEVAVGGGLGSRTLGGPARCGGGMLARANDRSPACGHRGPRLHRRYVFGRRWPQMLVVLYSSACQQLSSTSTAPPAVFDSEAGGAAGEQPWATLTLHPLPSPRERELCGRSPLGRSGGLLMPPERDGWSIPQLRPSSPLPGAQGEGWVRVTNESGPTDSTLACRGWAGEVGGTLRCRVRPSPCTLSLRQGRGNCVDACGWGDRAGS